MLTKRSRWGLLAAMLLGLVLGACGGEEDAPAAIEATPDVTGTSVALGGVAAAAASCAFMYDTETLADRPFAFDGTVTSIVGESVDPPADEGGAGYVEVTFEVREWFHGGAGVEATVQMFPPNAGVSIETPDYGIGSRLLVTGEPRWGGDPLDDAVAWYCGFTRTYDETTAEAWRAVFE